MAHTQTRASTGFQLAFRGGRRLASDHRSGPAGHFQALRRLPQQNLGRDHFLVNTVSDGIHTVPLV
jgi:hypothetical protein